MDLLLFVSETESVNHDDIVLTYLTHCIVGVSNTEGLDHCPTGTGTTVVLVQDHCREKFHF